MAEARTFYNKLELTIKDTRPGITSQSGQIMCYPDMARALGNHVNLVSVARGWRVWHNLGSPTCSAIARKAPMDVTVEEFQDLKAIAAQLDDPRAPINILHPVENIIAISIAAIIAGAEGPKSIARWADEKKDWLATWLPLPQEKKKPSRDCMRTLFGRVDPVAFQTCFFDWLNGFLSEDVRSDDLLVMAIDGKTLRHSFDTAKARRPLHIVSA